MHVSPFRGPDSSATSAPSQSGADASVRPLLTELLNRSKLLEYAVSHVEAASAQGGRPAQREALKALYHTVQLVAMDLSRLRDKAVREGVVTPGGGYNEDWLVQPSEASPEDSASTPVREHAADTSHEHEREHPRSAGAEPARGGSEWSESEWSESGKREPWQAATSQAASTDAGAAHAEAKEAPESGGTATATELDQDELPRGNEKVLVVDADDATREPAIHVLRELGYRVHEARSAEEAIAHLAANSDDVHLLLTALQLPSMGGPQLAETVMSWRPGVRVLFTPMADAHAGVAVEAYQLPFRSWAIAKPFRPTDLAFKVREVLEA
ncbi:MAG TPA: response regulator [Gemmatimonadales bacterium]|nr:response regulator [Gemmatimonadales bacterium]